MYRRNDATLPTTPDFLDTLKENGFQFNPNGQLVSTTTPPSFFSFYFSNNDRVNSIRKEIIHGCVREAVHSSLASMGVKPLYLSGTGGAILSKHKPDSPHVAILTSEPELLKQKREVILVINERNQDLGIWGWPILMREGGINQGSAVGLIKKLSDWAVSDGTSSHQDFPNDSASQQDREDSQLSAPIKARDLNSEKSPGVVIINPGQLVYSPSFDKSMSYASWIDRSKPAAMTTNHKINKSHNAIPAHEDSEEHTTTVLKSILPRLINMKSRLFVVAISSGADTLLTWLDNKLDADPDDLIGQQLGRVALMATTHYHGQLKSKALKSHLARFAESYIMNPSPAGTLLQVPTLRPVMQDSAPIDIIRAKLDEFTVDTIGEAAMSAPPTSSPLAERMNRSEMLHEQYGESSAGSRNTESSSDFELPFHLTLPSSSSDDLIFRMDMSPRRQDFVARPSPLQHAQITAAAENNSQKVQASFQQDQESSSSDSDQGLFMKASSIPLQSIANLRRSNRTASRVAARLTPASAARKPSEPPKDFSAEINVPGIVVDDDASSIADKPGTLEQYDSYLQEQVSCPTYSAGGDVEMVVSIWPNVMDRVLQSFREYAEENKES